MAAREECFRGGADGLNVGPLRVFSGGANRELAVETAALLGTELGDITIRSFPDSETYIQVNESVRGSDVFIIQPTSYPVNENAMQLFLMIDAFRRASAGRITAVIPYYGYSRQERKAKPREPISAKMVADVLTTVGADRVVTVDVHSPAMQGFFSIPVDSLTTLGMLSRYLEERDLADCIVVAADTGRMKFVEKFSDLLGLPLAFINKRRRGVGDVEVTHVVGDVNGKTPIIIDDIVASGSVVTELPALLKAGAKPQMILVSVHAVLVGKAIELLQAPFIHEVITTNTLAIPPEKRFPKLTVRSVAPLLADAISRIHCDESVSPLFQFD